MSGLTLNMNVEVKFKITEFGKKVLSSYKYAHYIKPDENGMYRMQLWEFANVFGCAFHCGTDPVTENNEIIIDSGQTNNNMLSSWVKANQFVSISFSEWMSLSEEDKIQISESVAYLQNQKNVRKG